MANIIILSPSLSDAAVLAASSQVASLPVVNLQNYQPKKKYRSAGTTEFVTIDMLVPVACNGLAWVGHNFTAAGTIRVRGAATPAAVTSAPVVDTTALSAWPSSGVPNVVNWPQFLSWLSWANTTPLRYWRIDIVDPANPAGYLQAGRLMLGTYWQPTLNFDLAGTPLAFDQRDVLTITDYGELFTDRRAKSSARLFNVTTSSLDKLEVLNGIAEIQRQRGMWGDVVCLLDPAETTNFHMLSLQGVFNSPQSHSITPLFTANGVMWSVKFSLREIP